ncbi:MAG: hypothetical protein HY864_12100 [Chloroflexi bacterium]|nr:hypothetical protein [Chloroflexota bacterium]
MNDDVRKYIYGTVVVFLVGLLAWVTVVYVSSCGVTLVCKQGALPVERTPIPTLFPAALPASDSDERTGNEACRVAATDLVAAWVAANSPETEAFEVVDANGVNCEATFADVALLFNEPNIWASGAAACSSCHVADVAASPAQLDMTSYAGVMAGSRRADAESKGTDILGGGSWEKSLLFEFLATSKANVAGHTSAVSPAAYIFAGKPVPESTPTP